MKPPKVPFFLSLATYPKILIVIVFSVFYAETSAVWADTIISDTFSDGSVSKTGSTDLTYYSTSASNVSIIQDSTLDSASSDHNVLKLLNDRSAIAPLGQTITLTSSAPISLAFDFRYITATSSTLRIGLYYDYGTTVTSSSDFSTNSADDQGIFMSLTATGIQGASETGGASGGGIMAGSDRSYGTNTSYTLDTNTHHAVITYSLSATTVTASFSVDGTSYGSVSAVGMTTTFNEFALTTLTNSFEIDNITISTIPEPQTWSLIFIGLAGLGIARFIRIFSLTNTHSC